MKMTSQTRGLVGRTLALGLVPLGLLACGDSGDTTASGTGGSVATTGGGSFGGASAGGTSTAAPQGGSDNASGGATSAGTGGAANSSGGSTSGGATSGGGSANGGASSGGAVTGLGGSSSGGVSGGGTTSTVGGGVAGGTAAGGVATGGASAGGTTSSGGTGSGGVVVGGRSSGGRNSGGVTASGGVATGGTSRGGAASGGTSTGGSATGGAGTGGTTSTSDEFWISPSGNDSNPGTKDAPMLTFCDTAAKVGACYKLCPSGGSCRGGTIWVMAGTYRYSATQKTGSSMTGSASAPLNLFAESGAAPVFDFTGMAVDSANRGLQIAGTYWHLKGLTVTKAGDTGIMVMGADITVEQCVAHHNADAGIVIGVNSNQSGSGANNLILNCDSYQNADSANGGENADGFGMKENSGAGNVFRGCRAWDNADDGWDLYAWASPVTIDNCWTMSQSKTTGGSNSDGNGFKLGGDDVSAKHVLSNLYSTDNAYGSSKRGFTNNSNPASMSCSNCASWGNGASDNGVSGISTSAPGSATASKMIAAKRNADGSLPSVSSL